MGTVAHSQPQAAPSTEASGRTSGDPPVINPKSGSGVHALVERFAIPIAFLISLIAICRYAVYATRRLWFDEIYTYTVALQPTWSGVWKAYSAAVDMQPPLFAYLTRISWTLFGRSELALRLPQIAGVIVFSWCLFLFVGKRLGYVFGLCAMILTLANGLEVFAGEARPYGMLLGACGLALLAWRNAVENPQRPSALTLFAASLALIVATHAYAIIVVAMIGIAELFRFLWTRCSVKMNWKLWACFLATLPPLALYWFPFHAVKAMQGVSVGPAKTVHFDAIGGFYRAFFSDRLLAVYLVGVLVIGFAFLGRGRKRDLGRPGTSMPTSMPAHEIVLALALAISPGFCVILAMLVTHYYQPRYSVYAVGGVVTVVIVLMDAVAPSRRVAALILLVISFFLFGLQQFCPAFHLDEVRKRDLDLAIPFSAVAPGTPLVIACGLAMLPTDMYASDAELSRTYYLLDHDLSIRYTGTTFFDFGPPLTDFYRFRMHLVNYHAFLKDHKKFFVYGPYYYQDDWQIRALQADGAHIVEKGKYLGEATDNVLLQVEMP